MDDFAQARNVAASTGCVMAKEVERSDFRRPKAIKCTTIIVDVIVAFVISLMETRNLEWGVLFTPKK